MKKIMIAGALMAGLLTTPLAAKQNCEQRLEAAKALTSHATWVAMQFDQYQNGVTMSEEALKAKYVAGRKQGFAELETIIEDCERQAKQTKDLAVAAPLFATVFNAKLARLGSTDHPGIYADAIATISSVDRHDETTAVVPFLVTAGMDTWHEDPEEAKHLMQRAIDLAEKHYGKSSPKRADILGNFAFLFSPRMSPGRQEKNPHADVKRAEALYSEALAIYDAHPEAMATYEYSGLVGQAQELYRFIGNEERANRLDARHSELTKAQREIVEAEQERMKAERKNRKN